MNADATSAITPVTVTDLRVEHHRGRPLGIGETTPRLSWITSTDVAPWKQDAYEVEVDGASTGKMVTDASVLVAWPADPLDSRQEATVRIRVWGTDGSESDWSAPLVIETGLLAENDWTAAWIAPASHDSLTEPGPAPILRRDFSVGDRRVERARLYVTSAGVHRLHLNGHVVGDHVLAPGWSSYQHRLRYDTHDVTDLLVAGPNALGAVVADGWWRGHLSWEMYRNVYGERLGLLAQLEITYEDGSAERITTNDEWRSATGPFLASDLYNGETYDARLELDGWDSPGFDDAAWPQVELFEPTVGTLVAPPGPPVRRIEELAVRHVITTPEGRTVLDFGQNLVGRVRFTVSGDAGATVTLRHAEVLEHGEPAYRPLRNAKATDRYTLRGGGAETYEPEFTFHGFRFVEVEGWPGAVNPADFVAVVLHSDMGRTGWFECSNELVNQLHSNVVWGMRGNFLDVPTDCPQRDERLGWTGDLQVFAPTAAYLFDTSGMLGNWMADLCAEQRPNGTVPVVIPHVETFLSHSAAWSDAVTIVPQSLHTAYGDLGVLRETLANMRAWVDFVAADARPDRVWTNGFQLGDWLDPNAPAEAPFMGKTDPWLVATAYFARSAQIVSDVAALLGLADVHDEYAQLAAEVREGFRREYITPNGRAMSDSVTAYAVALEFGLIEDPELAELVAHHFAQTVESWRYTIATGFVGTPLVLHGLTHAGNAQAAYRLLTQRRCPSWLYSVDMGATTIWERWNSMLPDGSVNQGDMTSFNHYAFGAVAQFMHEIVGGLAPAEPGYRKIRFAPLPGHSITSASSRLRTPYGDAECSWELNGEQLALRAVVPPNSTAEVMLPGASGELEAPIAVASGSHQWTYEVSPETVALWADESWDPLPAANERERP